MDLVRICDGLFPLPVEEKVIMGTWHALAIPFPPCLSRKRQSWEHGVRLRVPFLPACRGKGRPGVPAIHFSPLPVEDKDSRGTRQGSVTGMHMGLRSALKGSVGLRRALWLGLAIPLTGRGKWPSQARLFGVLSKIAFSPTGRGKKVGESQGETPPLALAF